MTDENTPEPTGKPDAAPAGDRIAKVIARAGLASRRVAERMILAGRVAVNGKTITSPALDVTPQDKVTVDGKPLDAPQETRMWVYHKPAGLITTESDELGRRTIYDEFPDDLPRVLTVGRLDLNSEGLLLLTNDGGLKRRLELPETGWLRRYRVRVNGRPTELTFEPLRRGVTIDGEEFQPMEVTLDSQRGDNAWLTVSIREGRNREIRRTMEHVGLKVNRLIRLSYGPFRLGPMKRGEIKEIRRRILRDQLGILLTGEEETETPETSRGQRFQTDRRPARGGPRPHRAGGGAPYRGDRPERPGNAAGDGKPPRQPRGDYARRPRPAPGDGPDAGGPPHADRKPRHKSGRPMSDRTRSEGYGSDRQPRPDRREKSGDATGQPARRFQAGPGQDSPRGNRWGKPWPARPSADGAPQDRPQRGRGPSGQPSDRPHRHKPGGPASRGPSSRGPRPPRGFSPRGKGPAGGPTKGPSRKG